MGDVSIEVKLHHATIHHIVQGDDGDVARYTKRIAGRVRSEARVLCPVLTGKLRDSIKDRVERDGASELIGLVGSDVHYSPYVELGTRYMSEEPFLRPGLIAGVKR